MRPGTVGDWCPKDCSDERLLVELEERVSRMEDVKGSPGFVEPFLVEALKRRLVGPAHEIMGW